MEARESDGYKQFAVDDKVIVAFRKPGRTEVELEVNATVVASPSEKWLTWDAIDVRIDSGPDPTEHHTGHGQIRPVPVVIVRQAS